MLRLTDRLQVMADCIKETESVCDIGTDHGYLGIYLKEKNPERTIILTDVSRPSLEKARSNAKKLSSYELDLRLGNGLEVLKESETDVITIAGMGGLLMCDILACDLHKAHSFSRYVLQPRNHAGNLRHYLLSNGFVIEREHLVKEGRFICEILEISNGTSEVPEFSPESIEMEIPESTVHMKSPLVKDYLSRKLLREKRVLFNLYASTHISKEKVELTKHNIAYINSLIDRL